MIATVALWFATSRIGRALAMAGAVVMAVVTFGAWQRREGRRMAERVQEARDNAAVDRAQDADRRLRDDGGARERLRRGDF